MDFYETEPTRDNCWRAVILFGDNQASYKFALAKALYDLRYNQSDLITLSELAAPYSKHICEHLIHSPKQCTSRSSKFLNACKAYNSGEISKDELTKKTVQYGFGCVINAFHNVKRSPIKKRFFIDERLKNGGIRLTDDFFLLTEDSSVVSDLTQETESRWRLVETAWAERISRNLLKIEYDQDIEKLYSFSRNRRINITSCRGGLNGYQKGKCFYCSKPISIKPKNKNTTHVDHFFPWSKKDHILNIDGIWNLVLACPECNLSKGAQVPQLDPWLKKLHKRNENLIRSHHPLRETIIHQTGATESMRRQFLQNLYNKWNVTYGWTPKS